MGNPDSRLVSVIIPCYNQAQFLGEAIESVLTQTHRHSEIIVVNDGSTDNVAEVAARYPTITYISQPNKGISAARNRGIEASRGDYLVFLDSDDRLLPHALEIGLKQLEDNPDCALVFGRCRHIAADGSVIELPELPRIKSDYYLNLLRTCYIYMPSMPMYRRSAFGSTMRFDSTVNTSADYDVYLRIAREFPIHNHDEVVAEYRKHGANVSLNVELMWHATLTVLRRQWDFIKGDKRYEAAYESGVRQWNECYSEQAVDQVRRRVRKQREWGAAARDLWMLVRRHPRSLITHALRKMGSAMPTSRGGAGAVKAENTAHRLGRRKPESDAMIDLICDRVSKRYRIHQESEEGGAKRNPLLRKLDRLRAAPQEFWAVRDVSFEVRRGEATGIIGHNGAGKSTLLKLLSSITAPTSGEITINGHLSALIEVGSGFHPELTGRENIFLSGSILGMRRREIAAKLDDIIDFAGVRLFIDTPVKRYSSGMYMRLGFSIAAHLDPEILLLDEVLAVGDTAFQERCIKRIDDLRRAGTTIVFISHDLSAVERLCDRVLLMQRGEVIADGPPREVIAEYQRTASQMNTPAPLGPAPGGAPKQAEVTFFSFYDAEGQEATVFRTGDPLTARVRYMVREQVYDANIEAHIYSADGQFICQLTSRLSNERIDLPPGTGEVELRCDQLGLQPGFYYLNVEIWQRGTPGHDGATQLIECQTRRAMLRVDPGKIVHGNFYMPHEWRFMPDGAANGVGGLKEHSLSGVNSRA